MKKRIYIFSPLVLVTFLCNLAWGQVSTAPEIFFKDKVFEANEVMEGTPVEHTYTVYNKGNAVLKIRKVRPG